MPIDNYCRWGGRHLRGRHCHWGCRYAVYLCTGIFDHCDRQGNPWGLRESNRGQGLSSSCPGPEGLLLGERRCAAWLAFVGVCVAECQRAVEVSSPGGPVSIGSGLEGLSSEGGESSLRLEVGEQLRIGDVGADLKMSSASCSRRE